MNIEGKGTRYEADTRQLADRMTAKVEAHMRTGTHLWIVGVLHEVDPSNWGDNPQLDESNLINVNGPGCYICEQLWSKYLAHRRCPGTPT